MKCVCAREMGRRVGECGYRLGVESVVGLRLGCQPLLFAYPHAIRSEPAECSGTGAVNMEGQGLEQFRK